MDIVSNLLNLEGSLLELGKKSPQVVLLERKGGGRRRRKKKVWSGRSFQADGSCTFVSLCPTYRADL